MDRAEWRSDSERATRAIGRALGESLIGGAVIGLVGPLGTGKTQFVKGVAVGNGLDDAESVTSPTFALMNEYPGRLRLFHLDAYRLRGPDDFARLGVDELVTADSMVVVEWADRICSAMPDADLWITITPVAENTRVVAVEARGANGRRLLRAWTDAIR
jgi:tRNA threonylcarbamoyladenosine biosynthesis protein TsaE